MGELFHRVIVKLFGDGKNWALFLFSLLVAFLLWYARNISRPYNDFATVSVRATCNIDGHSSESVNVSELTVRCKATGYHFMLWRGKQKREESINVNFDRKDLYHFDGEYYYTTADNLENYNYVLFGENTVIENYMTDTLFFRFPYEDHKKVPVRLVNEIFCSPQFCISGDIKLEPDSVLVYGPPSFLQSIDYVETQPLRLYDQHNSKAGIIALKENSSLRLSESFVRYGFFINRYVEHTLTLPVKVKNVPDGKMLYVLPTSITLTCRCAFPTTAEMLDDMSVYVDYNDFVKSKVGTCIPCLENVPNMVLNVISSPQTIECLLAITK